MNAVFVAVFLTASFYSDDLAGKAMANRRSYRPNAMTCASWDYPLGTKLTLDGPGHNSRWVSCVVTVTDRGPAKRLLGTRQIDLSRAAFEKFAMCNVGLVRVRVVEVKYPKGKRR